MKAKTIKLYEEEGTKYQFDSEKFKMLINQKKLYLNQMHKKTTKAEIMESIADELCVSTEAIKNWMYGYNGPSDIEQVKKIGDCFETDYHFLLKKEEDKMSTTVKGVCDGSEQALYTRERIREIYSACLNYVVRGRYYQEEIFDVYDFYKDGLMPGESIPGLMRAASQELFSAISAIRDLLNENMLDIPESFYDKVYNYTCEREDAMTDYYHFCYSSADREEGQEEELTINEKAYEEACNYFINDKGISELRELFQDYIVN